MSAILSRFGLLVAIAGAAALALLAPAGGEALRSAPHVFPALTAMAIFASGASIELAHVREAARERAAIALALGGTYLAAPLLAAGWIALLGPPIEGSGSDGALFHEAVFLAAAQAGTIASAAALTLVARGNLALALLLTISSNVLTVVATPLVLRLSLGTIVSFPTGEMMARMAVVVLLPVVAAQLVRAFVWTPGARGRTALRLGSQGIIVVFVYTGLCSAIAAGLPGALGVGLRLAAVVVALHLSLVALLHATSTRLGIDPRSRVAVVLCGSQKTLPNGIYLWDRFFPGNPYGALALIGYHVFQLVADTLLAPRLGPRRDP